MHEARTKILCTVGPACAGVDALLDLIDAGADGFRVNGAHVAPADLAGWIGRIRQASRRAGLDVAVMVDLPGTKLRVGPLRGGVATLATGAAVRLFTGRGTGDAENVRVRGIRDLSAVRAGAVVLLVDGRIRLRVKRRRGTSLHCVVLDGGELEEGKGVDFPGARLKTTVPTAKDRKIARAAVAAGADMLALSFVRSPDAVTRLRRLLAREGAPDLPVVVKIERGDAVDAVDAILGRADAAIVARGDLGVDVGPERVPTMQKRIIEAGRRAGRPVLVATEMLESMIENARPTRAEASDVANAVFEGADGVMLSGETAVGKHPAAAVRTMARIVVAAEADPHAPYAGSASLAHMRMPRGRPDQHVVHAAVTLAEHAEAEAIVVFTRTGMSALRLSKERPHARIHAFAPTDAVCRRLALCWGVRPKRLPAGRSTDALIHRVTSVLRDAEGLDVGARAVLVMGGAQDPAGATTLIKLLTL